MSTPIPEEQEPGNESTAHPAVQACTNAWYDEYMMCKEQGMSDYNAREQAKIAYKGAMPDLGSEEKILGFIACVGRGMLLNVFGYSESAKLLYAAQVASQYMRAMQKHHKPQFAEPKAPTKAAA